MAVLLANNAASTLAGSLTLTALNLTLAAGTGARFPAITAPNYFYLTIIATTGEIEIVKVTARVNDTLVIVRAQDGTTAKAFAAGARVELRINAKSVLDAVDDGVAEMTVVTDALDTRLDAVEAKTTILDSVTASAAEINILDGVTASTAELNILDGVVATPANLNVAANNATFVRDTVTALLNDNTLTYTAGQPTTVAAGNYIWTRSEQFSYQVAASGATNHQLVTLGGVKLYVLPVQGVVHVRAFGAVGTEVAGSDDTAELQAFFTYATANPGRYTFDWSGEWNISSTVNISGNNSEYVCGALYCIAPMNIALTVNGIGSRFVNYIYVYGRAKGLDVLTYTNRNVTTALVDIRTCGLSVFDGFYVLGSKRDGVLYSAVAGSNSISANFGRIVARACGSASPNETPQDWSINFSFTNRVDTGDSNGTNQRSTLTVPAIPAELKVNDYVRLANEFYRVEAIDTVAGTIAVFPWILNLATTSGTLYSCHGAGLTMRSANSTGIIIDGVSIQRCGVGIDTRCLYGPTIKGLVAEVAAIALLIDDINIGITITGFHPEVNVDTALGIMLGGSPWLQNGTLIGNNVPRERDMDILVPLSSTGVKSYRAYPLTFVDGVFGVASLQGLPYTTAAAAAATRSNKPGENRYIINRSLSGFTLSLEYNEDYDRLFGYRVVEIYQATNNANKLGSGTTLTLQPTTADAALGVTIMNGASYVLPATSNARKVTAVYETATKNWVIIVDEWHLRYYGSATFDPPSINNAASTTTTVTVTGAALGDYAEASFSLSLSGVTLSAYVSATNTVTVVFTNLSGVAVNLGSGTLRATVRRP